MTTLRSALTGLLAAGLLAACGGASPPPPSQAELDAEDEEDRVAERDEELEDDDASATGLDPALLRADVPPLELGPAVALPGTGVRLRPPEGAEPLPFGAGFLARGQRVQISVVVAEGSPEVLDAIRTGGQGAPPPAQDVEEVTIDGQAGRIGKDRVQTQGGGALERTWLLVHDGERGLGIVATYEATRGEAYREGLREALRTVEWDREVDLDAEAALGVAVDAVEGLELSRRSTANLVMIAPGNEFPPEAGDVVLTVAPLPMQVPPAQAVAVCPQLAERLVPAPSGSVHLQGEIEDGTLPGCERLATAPTAEGPEIVTYAAVLFSQGMPLLVTGSAAADELETWRPRFASAARSLRVAAP